MLERNYSLYFQNMSCTILDPNGSELCTMKVRNRLFLMNLKNVNVHAYTTIMDNSDLWHKRFSHFSIFSLKHMHDNHLVDDIPTIYDCDEVCKACLLGK